MNLGAEPKKMAILAGLAVVGGYVFYTNVLSSGPESESPKTAAPAVVAPPLPNVGGKQAGAHKMSSRVSSQEFRPKLPVRPEDRPNYATIDPTLRLDLLKKVQAVEAQGGSRSLFQFSTAPLPEAVKGTMIATTVIPGPKRFGPERAPTPTPVPTPRPDPPPPAIALKFFGFAAPKPDGSKRAFFLDGDDIFVASEGELVKKRYRVVTIGVNSVVMEDTQFKNNRQTLVLLPEAAAT
jgi:hypothetical protein